VPDVQVSAVNVVCGAELYVNAFAFCGLNLVAFVNKRNVKCTENIGLISGAFSVVDDG